MNELAVTGFAVVSRGSPARNNNRCTSLQASRIADDVYSCDTPVKVLPALDRSLRVSF
jgi:hypothetical protein